VNCPCCHADLVCPKCGDLKCPKCGGLEPLPSEFVEWVQQNHGDLLEHRKCKYWKDLYWLSKESKDDPIPVVRAVVEEAGKRGLLETLVQSCQDWPNSNITLKCCSKEVEWTWDPEVVAVVTPLYNRGGLVSSRYIRFAACSNCNRGFAAAPDQEGEWEVRIFWNEDDDKLEDSDW